MSIVGLRSYEYQRAADLDRKLRRFVERVRNDPEAKTHDAQQARWKLALELDTLADHLDPLADEAALHSREALRLPVPMLRRLRDARVNGQRLPSALKATVGRLRTEGVRIDDDDLALLDLVLAAASYEASDAFDRVVRR